MRQTIYKVIKDDEVVLETTDYDEALLFFEDVGGDSIKISEEEIVQQAKKEVTYLGETISTTHIAAMTNEQYQEFIEWYYTKPTKREIIGAITNVVTGGGRQYGDYKLLLSGLNGQNKSALQ